MGILFQEHSIQAVHGRGNQVLNMTPEELNKIGEKTRQDAYAREMAAAWYIKSSSKRAEKSESEMIAQRSQKNVIITFKGDKNNVPILKDEFSFVDLPNVKPNFTPEIKNTDYNKVRPFVDSLESQEIGNTFGIIKEKFDIIHRKKQHQKSHPYGTGVSFEGEESMNTGFRVTHRASVPRIENKDKYHILKVLPKVHNPINNDKLAPPGFTSDIQLYEVKNSGLANVRKKVNGPVNNIIQQAQDYTDIINFANTDKQAHTVHSKMQSSVIFVPEAGYGAHNIDEWEINSKGKEANKDYIRLYGDPDYPEWTID